MNTPNEARPSVAEEDRKALDAAFDLLMQTPQQDRLAMGLTTDDTYGQAAALIAIAQGRAALKSRGEGAVERDAGPWEYGVTADDRAYLQSDDFTHDVRLYISGDFRDEDQRKAYGLKIAAVLASPAAEPASEGVRFRAWVDKSHRMKFIDSIDELLRLINGGAKLSNITIAAAPPRPDDLGEGGAL